MAQQFTWTIGPVTISRVEEVVIPVPWERLVPDGAALVDGCGPWIDPFVSDDKGQLLLSIHSFVVETPETLIVIDTCIGDSAQFQMQGDSEFCDRLLSALPGGLGEVDIVVCTHLHFDHVGWNTIERNGALVPRFPNAQYLVTEVELAADRDEEDSRAYARSVEPLAAAGCLESVASDHRIDSWVALEPSPGHTPGHVAVRIDAGSDGRGSPSALIIGDVAHTPLQLAHPTASSKSDHNPEMATSTRQRYVAGMIDSGVLILGTHFPPPTGGYLSSVPSGTGNDGKAEVRFG